MTEEHATGDDHDEDGTSTRSWTRRGLIAGVAAAGVGAAVGAVGGVVPADAGGTQGGNLILGEENSATATTEVSTSEGIGLVGNTTDGTSIGVVGSNQSTTTGTGVSGEAVGTGGTGVSGLSGTGSGLRGSIAAGVVGDASTVTGVAGFSSGNHGVSGITNAHGSFGVRGLDQTTFGTSGVYGGSTNGSGVTGVSGGTSGLLDGPLSGVVGDTDNQWGVVGASSGDHGVYGLTNLETYAGVYGSDQSAGGGYGLVGQSQTGIGVLGTTSASGEGIAGIIGSAENGYGVYASGGLAPLFLFPAASAGAPTTGLHGVGEVYTDSRGVLYACVAGGTPGTWVQLAAGPTGYASGASCLLPTAIRLFDSREADPPAAPTRAAGPLPGGSSPQTLQVTGTEVGGVSVPIGAVAVLGNLTATGAAGPGYLATAAGGSAQPSTSSLNYQATTSIANAVTVPLSDTGQIAIWSNTRTNVLFDATGFIG